MSEQIFLGLSIIIAVVLITLGVMKIFKQPMIIGYIIAGTIISIFLPTVIHQNIAIESFSTIGVSFLLFMIGMELNPNIIKDLGKTALIAGILQVLITSMLGIALCMFLGFDIGTSMYIGIGLAFSSTIVVLKILSDKDETESTFGRLSIGILIVQDLIVMLMIIGISAWNNIGEGNAALMLGIMALKIIGLGGLLFVVAKYLIPRLTKYIAESQEYLFLFAIGWCLILGSIFYYMGFSIEIGALLAGVTLANSSYRFEITSRIKPLRDFFIMIFFVLLGAQIQWPGNPYFLIVLVVLTAFVLIIKPLITSIILGFLGHTKKNNLLTGIALSQISEFSLLFITMGISSGVIKDPMLIGMMTLVGLLSIAGSSYGILYKEKLYHHIKGLVKWMPGLLHKEIKDNGQYKSYDIILFGYGRFGSNLHDTIYQQKSILVVDERPGIFNHLKMNNIPCLYGDVGDIDFLESLPVKNAKMIISTVKKFDENMILLKTMKYINPKIIVVLVSNHVLEAIKLYEQGADYVIMPHYLGVNHTSLILEEYGFDINKFMQNKESQLSQLKERHQDMVIEALQRK